MSLRSYLLYLAFAFLLLIIIGVLLWPFLQVDDALRNLITEQISRSFLGQVELRGATPGFFRLNLYSLMLSDPQAKYSLKVREIHIFFSPYKFFRHRFNLLKSVSAVSLSYPEISICPASKDEKAADSVVTSTGQPRRFDWDLGASLPEDIWISKATLNSGTLQLVDPRGEVLWSLKDLNGEIGSPRPGVLKGLLRSGSESGGASGSELRLFLNVPSRTFESVLTANLTDLSVGHQFGLPDSIELALDSLQADLRLWVKDSLNSLDGEIHLRHLSLRDKDRDVIQFDTLNFTLGQWKLFIPPAKARGLTADWVVRGQIPDLRDPSWDLKISARSQASRGLANWLPPGFEPSGKLSLQSRVSGKVASPQVQLRGSLERLKTQIDLFEDIHFSGEFDRERLKLTQLRAHSTSGEFELDGTFNFEASQHLYRGQFHWQGPIPGLPGSAQGTLDAQVSGANGLHELNGEWLATGTSSQSVEIQAAFSAQDDRLRAGVKLTGGASFAEIVVSQASTRPSYHLKFAEPTAIMRKFYPWDGWDRLKDFVCRGELEGRLDEMHSEFEIYYGKGPSRFQFEGTIRMQSPAEIEYDGALNFQQGLGLTLQGQVAFKWSQGALTLENLELDNAIYAQGSVNLKSGEIGLTELLISKWDVSRGVQLVSPDWAERVGGILDGRIEAYGTLDDPVAAINFYASQGYFNQQTNFWAVFSAELSEKKLKVNECIVGRGVLSLLRFQGRAALDRRDLDFLLSSDRADVSDFLSLLGSNPLRMQGPLKLEATLGGSFEQPQFNLTADIAGGRLYKIPFERLRASVQMDSTTRGSLYLKELHLVQSGDLKLDGLGTLPLGPTPLNLRFLLEGNVLKIPNLIDEDILLSQGQGRVIIELGQVDGRVRLKYVQLDVHDGVMRFPEVVDEIGGLQTEIHTEGNRVIIGELRGQIEGQPFSFGNFFRVEGDTNGYAHLYFPAADLDLGVVTLETMGRGIFARIPTLMQRGSKGYFRLLGKTDDERFMFTGPIRSPLIRGTLKVSSTIMTYPFPPSKGEPSRFVRGVLSVLKSARWDLEILTERDNRYVREIRGLEASPLLQGMSELLTTVDIDVSVNPGVSQLDVLGCINSQDFRFLGSLISTRGTIEYLDMKFKVDRFTVEFDEHDPLPWVEGRGEAVYIDSLGQTRNIYLTLYVVDPTTGERTRRGRWGEFVFIIEDDAGSSQEQILAAMGYSPEQITDKMTSISGMIISDAVLRRWIRPIERELETLLDIDFIRLQPTIAQHLFETEILGTDPGPESQVDWGAYFLRQSQLSVGKYLSDDLFLTYTGLWESAINAQNERHFGFLHRWSLEYRIRPLSRNLILKLGYEYDSLEQLRDRDVGMRYSILF